MKRKEKISGRLAAAALLFLVILGVGGCAQKDRTQEIEKQAFYLNTICNIRLKEWEGDRAAGEDLVDRAFLLCASLEQKLSRTIEGSDVDRINQAMGQPVRIEDEAVAEALRLGMDYSRLSGGRFDITVGRLSELWNFSADQPSVPDEKAIKEAVSHVGYENFSIEPEAVSEKGSAGGYKAVLKEPGAKIDLGAVAKGYIVDQVSDFLRENGVSCGIVDFGGNISCIGQKKDGKPWSIGIRRPVSSEESTEAQAQTIGAVWAGADCSVVTSGTYERCFVSGGKTYHHILDPATGYPCDTDVVSVTIIGKNSGECDGLSTVCLLLGVKEGLALIESLPGFEAVFVDALGQIKTTSQAAFTEYE